MEIFHTPVVISAIGDLTDGCSPQQSAAILDQSTRVRTAFVGLVTRLLAVVTYTLGGTADFSVVTNFAAFIAGSTRKRRHVRDWHGLVEETAAVVSTQSVYVPSGVNIDIEQLGPSTPIFT
jgi:hypothetical protein